MWFQLKFQVWKVPGTQIQQRVPVVQHQGGFHWNTVSDELPFSVDFSLTLFVSTFILTSVAFWLPTIFFFLSYPGSLSFSSLSFFPPLLSFPSLSFSLYSQFCFSPFVSSLNPVPLLRRFSFPPFPHFLLAVSSFWGLSFSFLCSQSSSLRSAVQHRVSPKQGNKHRKCSGRNSLKW